MPNKPAPEKRVIHAHPELADLIPGYLAARRQDLAEIRSALARADYPTLSVTGHRMRGTGASYGFDGLSEIGSRIEEAARASDNQAAARAALELEEYLDSLEVIYSRDSAPLIGKMIGKMSIKEIPRKVEKLFGAGLITDPATRSSNVQSAPTANGFG